MEAVECRVNVLTVVKNKTRKAGMVPDVPVGAVHLVEDNMPDVGRCLELREHGLKLLALSLGRGRLGHLPDSGEFEALLPAIALHRLGLKPQ
ncbi:MAG: hypothetical protein KDH09_16205 [Chrysiogenetes bacterium]|nr:hypothetical protein [Chrysiogenetes bacterium]